MKRRFLLILTAIILGLSTVASAAPVLTDGKVTAWIAADNTLYLRPEDQAIRWLNLSMDDLLSFDQDYLYVLDSSRRILAVRRDGSGFTVTAREPDQAEIDKYNETRFTLEDGILTAGGRQLSTTAGCATSDGTFVYWAEKSSDIWKLKQATLDGQPAPAGMTLQLDEKVISEPLSLFAGWEGLALTAADHSVYWFDPAGGRSANYPADGDKTEGAAFADGKLLRYSREENGAWRAQSEEQVLIPLETRSAEGGNTPEPTPAPTNTPTPVPTATPVPTPTATPYDDSIEYGARGSVVRRIQQRLEDLGYPVGNVDGIFGQDTLLAIKLFMGAIHVRERNYITIGVRRRLFRDDAPVYNPYRELRQGDKGAAVKVMQKRLDELGYDPGKIDGSYGAGTVKAVAQFQEDAGISPGEAEPGTVATHKLLKILYSDDAPVRLVTTGGGVYKLGETTATFVRPSSKSAKSVRIPNTLEANGKEYKIAYISAGACRNMYSLTKVTIGANVRKIGDNAFAGCKNLRTIAVKTEKLNEERLGAGIFTGVPGDASVTCPADMVKAYKKLFRSRGLPKSVPFNE